MKTFRTFGPTMGKGKLSKKIIKLINDKVDRSPITKKMITVLNLQVKLRMKLNYLILLLARKYLKN